MMQTQLEDVAIGALRRRDIAGLEVLVRRYQVQALRIAYAITGERMAAEDAVADGGGGRGRGWRRRTRSRMAAEDAVADAFVAVYDRIAQLDPARPFASWFFRIVANRALDATRRRRHTTPGRVAEVALGEQADPAPGPEEEVLRHERRDLVVQAIQELSPPQRAALVQRYYLELDEATVARIAGCAVGTIKSLLHAARR